MKFRILTVAIFVMAVAVAVSCKKKEEDPPPPTPDPTTVTDVDGNVYNIITIGNQKWLKENLKVTKYRDGSTIANVTSASTWIGTSSGAWCHYDNSATNDAVYGKLYNFYAVSDTRGLAPAGWHVATEADWNTLATTLGGATVAGGKLKESGTSHWATPNTGATNESGFTAVPGGQRFSNGSFQMQFSNACIWTSTTDGGNGKYILLTYNTAEVYTYSDMKKLGFSVRCVKD